MFLKRFFLGLLLGWGMLGTGWAQSGLGASFLNPVVIHENDTMRGIKAENRWIEENLPGFEKIGQKLVQNDQGTFDIITLQSASGEVREIYFEVSKFFGLYDGKPI